MPLTQDRQNSQEVMLFSRYEEKLYQMGFPPAVELSTAQEHWLSIPDIAAFPDGATVHLRGTWQVEIQRHACFLKTREKLHLMGFCL